MRIARSSVRLVLILSVILALGVPLGVFAYNHAHAQISKDTCHGYYEHCFRFDKNWTFDTGLYIPGFGPGNFLEMQYTLSGYIGYSFGTAQNGAYQFSNLHVLDADMNAKVYDCVTNCSGSGSVTTMDMTQLWQGDPACTGNVGLAFQPGPPWIQFSFSNSCSANGAQHATSASLCGRNVSGCAQDNTDSPLRLATWTAPITKPTATPCLGVNIQSNVVEYYPRDNQDHVAGLSSTSARQVCPPAPTF
jgi:hypothetical protein